VSDRKFCRQTNRLAQGHIRIQHYVHLLQSPSKDMLGQPVACSCLGQRGTMRYPGAQGVPEDVSPPFWNSRSCFICITGAVTSMRQLLPKQFESCLCKGPCLNFPIVQKTQRHVYDNCPSLVKAEGSFFN
jgi:hypothetical protein